MHDEDPKDSNPFASLAKDANNCKAPEPAGKKKQPTKALRPKPLPPIVMPNMFETFGIKI